MGVGTPSSGLELGLPGSESCGAVDYGARMCEEELEWIQFHRDDFSVADFSESLLVGFSLMELNDTPSWIDSVAPELNGIPFCLYPVRFGDGFVLGRGHNVTKGFMGQLFVGAEVVEERFVLQFTGSYPKMSLATLLSDDRVVVLQGTPKHFFTSRECQMVTFPRRNPLQRVPFLFLHEKFGCRYCARDGLVCDCPPRACLGDLAAIAEMNRLAESPIARWKSFMNIFTISEQLESSIKMEATPIIQVNSEFVRGPLTIRKTFSYSSEGVDLEFLYYGHLAQMMSRNFPSRISDGLLWDDGNLLSDAPEPFLDSDPGRHSPGDSLESVSVQDLGAEDLGSKPLCPQCGRTFSRKYELQRHISAVHYNVKNHVCSICDKAFALKQNLVSHVSEVHEKKKDSKCDECGQLFSTKYKLKRHIRSVHLKERPPSAKNVGAATSNKVTFGGT
eukprot:CAMPEP_0113964282 /NCGR_PEP_ID=MMETSP0011_2-20120614/7043_1 /TAXON_ID=101924 /ORGANISM="Rhodosorus marinus" /LENGTH=446 /DNA_ID=CAMNT_0000976547 /DNA_START=170 /DNA_END=1511 /DNA_ORIENTATION=- /assembly_acc=CAM_ASM_000156